MLTLVLFLSSISGPAWSRLHRFAQKRLLQKWVFDAFQEIKMILDDGKFEYFLERKFYSREKSKEPNFIGKREIRI